MPANMGAFDWLASLGPELMDRRSRIERWQRYYDGNQDLAAGPSQHRRAYREFQKKARTNLCKLAVDSMVHRMQVIGYNTGNENESRVSNQIWNLWQQARLDSRQFDTYRRALVCGSAFEVVGRDKKKADKPLVSIESANNIIIGYDPADPTVRLAALRLWHDKYENKWMATLFLPGERHAFRTKKEHDANSAGMLRWDERSWERRLEVARSFQDIPVVEFRNGAEGEDGRAEFDVAMDIQDRVNLTLLNRMTAERYAAFRQKYLLNFQVDYDEETGLPINPFNSAADSMFTVPPPKPGEPEPRFGDLPQTDTANMLRAVEADMSAFAAISITPIYYLPGDLINISAEGIAALDAGHTAKIREKTAAWSESHEEKLSLMAQVAGVKTDLTSAEIIWTRPENFDLSSMADYAVKLSQAGYPLSIIAAKLGDSPQQIEELRAEMASQVAREALRGGADNNTTGSTERGAR